MLEEEFERKIGGIIYNLKIHFDKDEMILRAHSEESKDLKYWKINLTKENFRTIIPTLKSDTQWGQVKKAISEMMKGKYKTEFTLEEEMEGKKNFEQKTVKIECKDEILETFFGKIIIKIPSIESTDAMQERLEAIMRSKKGDKTEKLFLFCQKLIDLFKIVTNHRVDQSSSPNRSSISNEKKDSGPKSPKQVINKIDNKEVGRISLQKLNPSTERKDDTPKSARQLSTSTNKESPAITLKKLSISTERRESATKSPRQLVNPKENKNIELKPKEKKTTVIKKVVVSKKKQETKNEISNNNDLHDEMSRFSSIDFDQYDNEDLLQDKRLSDRIISSSEKLEILTKINTKTPPSKRVSDLVSPVKLNQSNPVTLKPNISNKPSVLPSSSKTFDYSEQIFVLQQKMDILKKDFVKKIF